MRRLFFIGLLFLLSSVVIAQSVGVSSTAITPDVSSIFEVRATDKGLLIPRVALTSILDVATIAAPATSLLIYNTATAGVSPNHVSPGYYYWDGAKWLKFFTGAESEDWHLFGNTGTNPGTHFLGTTDAQALVFKTSNLERMRILSGGNVGIGTTTPAQRLHVVGNTYITGNYLLTSGHYLGINGDYNIYIDDANPIWHGDTYGGVIEFRGDNDVNRSKFEVGGVEIYRDLQVDGGLHDGTSFGTSGFVLVTDGVGDITWTDAQNIPGGNDDWNLLGNAGTSSVTNFLGTTDAQPLVFRTNNTEWARVQTDGTVSIGTNLNNDSRLRVLVPATNTTDEYGIYNFHDGTTANATFSQSNYNYSATNNTKYGVYSNVSNEGTGTRFGIVNYTHQNAGSSSDAYGYYGYTSSYGTGSHYASYNYLNLLGTGVSANNYASYNNMQISTSTNTSTVYGEYTYMDYSSGIAYGDYKDFNSHATYSSSKYGDYNEFNGTGNGISYGQYNEFNITGVGSKIGLRNEFANIQGTKFSVYNYVPSGTASGDFYGLYNIVSNDGTGSKYGVFNNFNGLDDGITYGLRNSIILGASHNDVVYGTNTYISNNGTGSHYGAYLNVPGGTNDYSIMAYAGNNVFNEIGGNYDFRIESDALLDMFFVDASTNRIGIGTLLPTQFVTIINSTPFSLGGSAAGVDNLYLEDHSMGAGDGNIGASISFSGPYNGGGGSQRRHIAIAGVQETVESDYIGMAFYTHNSTGSTGNMQESMRLSHDGNLGIGTTDPQTRVDIEGDIALRQQAATISITGGISNNNVSLASGYSFYRLTATGDAYISGFSGGVDGRIVVLHNSSSYELVLENRDLSSLTANRVELSTGDIVMSNDEVITLIYSDAEGCWLETAGTNNTQQMNDQTYTRTNTYSTAMQSFGSSTWTAVPGLSQYIYLDRKSKVMIWTSGVIRTTSTAASGGSGVFVRVKYNTTPMDETMQCTDAINNGTSALNGYRNVSSTWSTSHMEELGQGGYTFTVEVRKYVGDDADICSWWKGGGSDADYGKLTIMVVAGE